jgi:hypothetical protein
MSNDIRDIIERLAILEGRVTPTTVKSGLNPEQKSVKQLPALFKPKTQKILGGNADAKNPLGGWLVGDSVEREEEPLEEAKVDEEKLLDKVRDSLKDYLASVEEKYRDDSISKKAADKDLGKRAKDRDLVAKELDEDPTEEEPANTDQVPTAPIQNTTYSEPGPNAIKTYTMEDGRMCEIHGDEATGFEIRHGNRSMPSRFKTIDEASLALEMYQARCRAQNQSGDYIDEA